MAVGSALEEQVQQGFYMTNKRSALVSTPSLIPTYALDHCLRSCCRRLGRIYH